MRMALREWVDRRRGVHRQSEAFCPKCRRDLCSTVGVHCEDGALVFFRCVCGQESKWDFDAPVPFLIYPEASE